MKTLKSLMANNINITDDLLRINLIQEQNLLTIQGWSIAQDLKYAYDALLITMEDHLLANDKLNVIFNYNLFNTATAKFIFSTIKLLNKSIGLQKEVCINWIVDSENSEMLETASNFQEFCEFEFHISLN